MLNKDQRKGNFILLGKVKKISPVYQKKGDVIKIITLTDFFTEENEIVSFNEKTQRTETNLNTNTSKKGREILFFLHRLFERIKA